MDTLLERIRKTKEANCKMFAKQEVLNERLLHWVAERNPKHYNHNHYLALLPLTADDIECIIAEQKKRKLQGFILKSPWKLSNEIATMFDLTEEKQLIWAQINDNSISWKLNEQITIHDSQREDISELLLKSCESMAATASQRRWIRRTVAELLITASRNPNYHWLIACKDGQVLGRCYVFVDEEMVQMEDVWVAESARHQRIATTMFGYVCHQFPGLLFFHTEADSGVNEMYHKLGFSTVGEQFEYSKIWGIA